VTCGHTNILQWDFSADLPDRFNVGGSFNISGGVGLFDFPANGADWQTAELRSHNEYDLRGDSIALKVVALPTQAAGAWGAIEVVYPNGDSLFMGAEGGQLICGYSRGGNETSLASVAFSPTGHAYWRLREAQDVVHCEVSADGTTYTEIGFIDVMAALVGPTDAMRIRVSAGEPPNVATASTFTFDELRGSAPAGSWCKATSFTDDFPPLASYPPPAWDRSWAYNTTDGWDQASGTLNLHFGTTTDASGEAQYRTAAAYDMTGQRIVVEVLEVPPVDKGRAYFQAANADGPAFLWHVGADGLSCQSYDSNGGHGLFSSSTAPTFPLWLGLREQGGWYFCDVYESGAWKPYASTPVSQGPDPTHVDLVLGGWNDTASPSGLQVVRFDKLDLGP
jgi:hypothetical protein